MCEMHCVAIQNFGLDIVMCTDKDRKIFIVKNLIDYSIRLKRILILEFK